MKDKLIKLKGKLVSLFDSSGAPLDFQTTYIKDWVTRDYQVRLVNVFEDNFLLYDIETGELNKLPLCLVSSVENLDIELCL